jgi:hypothetical protein
MIICRAEAECAAGGESCEAAAELPPELVTKLEELGVATDGLAPAEIMNLVLAKAVSVGATTKKAIDVLRRNVRVGRAMPERYIKTWAGVLEKWLTKETEEKQLPNEDDFDRWQEQDEDPGDGTEVIWEGSGKEMQAKMERKKGESPLRTALILHLNQTVIDQSPINWTWMTAQVVEYVDELEREYEGRFPPEVTMGIEQVIHPPSGKSILAMAVSDGWNGAGPFIEALLERDVDTNLKFADTSPFLEACAHNNLVLAEKFILRGNGTKPLSGKQTWRGVGIDMAFVHVDQMVWSLAQELGIRRYHGLHAADKWVLGRCKFCPPLSEWKPRSPTLVKLLSASEDEVNVSILDSVYQSVSEWYQPFLRTWLQRCAGKCDLNRQVALWVGLIGAGSFNNTLTHILAQRGDEDSIRLLVDAAASDPQMGVDLTRVDSNRKTAAQVAAGGHFSRCKGNNDRERNGCLLSLSEEEDEFEPAAIEDPKRRADLQQEDAVGGWDPAVADLRQFGRYVDESDVDELDMDEVGSNDLPPLVAEIRA